MNEISQRIAIAEACGWTRKPEFDYMMFYPLHRAGETMRMMEKSGDIRAVEELPDYLNDLNAMHEAEKVLTDEQFNLYGAYLDEITLPENKMEMCYVDGPKAGMYRELICANAAQRAEAFLRTLNLWKETSEEA